MAFAQQPSMQRRQAVVGGSRGGNSAGSNTMTNTIQGKFSNMGRMTSNQQPAIDGNFLDDYVDLPNNGDRSGNSNYQGANNVFSRMQSNQNMNQQQMRSSNQFGRPPTGGNGMGMARTYNQGGFGNNQNSQGFRGGRSSQGFNGQGGPNQAYGNNNMGDGGMFRQGSQQSLQQFSQNSYGGENMMRSSTQGYGGQQFDRSSSNQFGGGGQQQFGRTMGGNNMRGLNRQGSMGMNNQGRFGQSFNASRMQNSGGYGGNNFQNSMQYNQQQYQNDQQLMYIIREIASFLNEWSQHNGKPESYLYQFDAYAGRAFEDWELIMMFEFIPPQDIQYLIQALDENREGQVQLRVLLQVLMNQVPQLNPSEFEKTKQSVWKEKLTKMRKDRQVFIRIAELIKAKQGNNVSYQQAYATIMYENGFDDRNPLEPYMPAQFINDTIVRNQEASDNFDSDLINNFLNFITIGRDSAEIRQLHFVRGLQALSPDQAVRPPTASPDMIGQSIDRMTGISGMDNMQTLEELLMKLPEQVHSNQTNPNVITLANALQNSGEMANLDKAFPNTETIEIKQGIGQSAKMQCCPIQDFEAFLKGVKDSKQNQLFKESEINVFKDLYLAEKFVAKPSAPLQQQQVPLPTAAAAAQMQHSRSQEEVKEATVEEENDQQEGAANGAARADEEIKIKENPLSNAPKADNANVQKESDQSPFKRADTDFDRADEEEEKKEAPPAPQTFRPSKEDEAKAKPEEQKNQPAPVPALDIKKADLPALVPSASKPEPEKESPAAKVEAAAASTEKPKRKKLGISVSTAQEQKEGGELEYYEGGTQNVINLQQFKKDLREAGQLNRSAAKTLIVEIFERIKKWYTMTGKSIKLMFRNLDKKKRKEVSKQDLIKVLTKVVKPFQILTSHVNAIMEIMGDATETLRYERFTFAYFDYANRNVVKQDDDLDEIISVCQQYAGKKTILTQLIKIDDRKQQQDPEYKFLINFETLIKKIKRQKGQVFNFSEKLKQELRQKICKDPIDKESADIVKLQELMGFKQEEIFDVQGNHYRQIAMDLQKAMLTIEQVQQMVVGPRYRVTMNKNQVADNWGNQVLPFQSDLDWQNFMGSLQEFSDGSADQVNVEQFLGRIEREINKFALLQKFYLIVYKKCEDKNSEFDDLAGFLEKKGMGPDGISVRDLQEVLFELELIGSMNENWEYFAEELEVDDDQIVSIDKFEQEPQLHLHHVEELVFKVFDMMDGCCKNETSKKSLKEELMSFQMSNQQPVDENLVNFLQQNHKPEYDKYGRIIEDRYNKNESKIAKPTIVWLHTFDLQRWFYTQVIPFYFNAEMNQKFDREVFNLFITYIRRENDAKDQIYMPHLLQMYMKAFPDRAVEQKLSEESLPAVVRHVCKVLDRENKKCEEYFVRNKYTQIDHFVNILQQQPFNTEIECELPTSLMSVIQNARKIRQDTRNIDVGLFMDLVSDQIKNLQMRSDTLLKIKKVLDERGESVQHALQQIKGTNDAIEEQGLELTHFCQLCLATKVKLDFEDQIMPVFDTFDKNMYGEVSIPEFILTFNQAHIGLFEETDEAHTEQVVKAKRYFMNASEVIEEICQDINDRNFSDFGSLLKGNDLFHEGKISHANFFQILQTVFDDLIGEGDILDVIKFFDENNVGTIQITAVQRVFNRNIRDQRNRIKLVSFVDACVEEQIVEPMSPKSKSSLKRGNDQAKMPEHYEQKMLLDIICGGIIKSPGDLAGWFDQYSNHKAGELNKGEFVMSLDRLGVESEILDKEIAYEYFVKTAAIKRDDLLSFHKKPISMQSLSVQELCLTLDEDMPNSLTDEIQDKLLKKVAQQLTELKLPVLDILKSHQQENDPGHIDQNIFAINVMENDFALKSVMTRNMINVLLKRYDNGQDTMLSFQVFLSDLEIQQKMYPTQITIFRTQEDINYFQTAEGAGSTMLKGGMMMIEPLKEPIYEAQSVKNTYYLPPYEEAHSQLNDTGTIRDAWNNDASRSFNMQAESTGHLKPNLEQHHHVQINDLIMATRRIGVSVEGYFQRFGKFSTTDGIRKIDNQQFKDAICNLDDVKWAYEKPYQVDELFDAFIIAFENMQRNMTGENRMNYNQTINSREQPDDYAVPLGQEGVSGEANLTLEQIGQCVYHNSSADVQMFEAKALQELHAVLFDTHMLDKLKDMVTFMNWERDSSCTISQFKSLLLDSMKLKGKYSEDKLDMLLQRYRQDAFQQAKIQRNELKSLTSDRLEVIKKGFSSVGKQRIQLLGCYNDLGYQQRKIGIKDQWAAAIAENITKAHQLKLYQEGQLPMTDTDLVGQMHSMFLRACQGHPDQLTYSDYSYMLTSMQLWDGQVHSRGEMDDFFKVCQQQDLIESNYFQPNSIDVSQASIPQYLSTQNFVKAFEFLARKPLSFIYQDLIDKFYVISKNQHISISGPTIVHMFDFDDLEESGFVHIEYFVSRIQEFLGRKRQKGCIIIGDSMSEHDLRFLGTKYMQRDGQMMVYYYAFIDDYDKCEKSGLGSSINQLSMKDMNLRRDIAVKHMAGQAGSWRIKTLSELTPPESKTIYEKMSNYLRRKDLIDNLCFSLVNADVERKGFLSKDTIYEVVCKNGMKISRNQASLITQVLVMNHQQEHNYLEMIALLVDEQYMYKIAREQGIECGDQARKPKKIDMELLKMSDSLKDQLELKYGMLHSTVVQLTRATMQIRDQELFKILKDCEIVCDSDDIDILEQYVTFKRDPDNNTLSFKVFLDLFQIESFTSDLLADIVDQLAKKNINLEEQTMQVRFSFSEFSELLSRVGVIISKDRQDTFEKLFEQLTERESELSRPRMLMCLGRDFANIQKPDKRRQGQARQLPEPPYAVNAFCAFLINRQINLRSYFQDQLKTKQVTVQQIKDLLDDHGFSQSAGDFDVMKRFFQVTKTEQDSGRGDQQSQRNSRRQTMARRRTTLVKKEPVSDILDLVKMIVYCRRIEPNYAKDDSQGQTSKNQNKLAMASFPQRIKAILKRISNYMLDNLVSKESLFQEMDRNNDDRITEEELVRFMTKHALIEGLPADDVSKLFSFLDANSDGHISINEFCMLINDINMSLQARMQSFSFEFDATLKSEIEVLFNKLDKDKNGSLNAEEFTQMVRPTDKTGSITVERAYEIIRKIDINGDSRISKPEFIQFLMPIQKRQILDFEDQMEDLRRLFKEQIAEGVASDPRDNQLDLLNRNQFVTKDGLRSLIIKAGHKAVTDTEIDAIFVEMDSDKNGTIDIDEFIAFVQVADRVKAKNLQARDAVFNIRKARLKLNSLDLLEMFLRMPLSFLPSFSMQELESRKHHLPIHGIQFCFDHQKMKYAGLQKAADLRQKQNNSKLYVAQHKPKLGLELNLSSDAVNVPLIQRLKTEYELPHFEIRVVLFDSKQKVYLSNFYILGAEAIRRPLPKGKTEADAQMSANLRYDPNLSSFFMASSQIENQHASLVFEIVIYSKNTLSADKEERVDKGNQVTVAWTQIQLLQLQTKQKHKLQLKGGNPFQEQELTNEEDLDLQKVQGKGLLKKIFGGDSNEKKKVDRHLTLDVKQFAKLPEQTQLELSSLPSMPESCLVSKHLLPVAVTFRDHCFQLLTKHEQEMTQPQLDLLMVQLPKIYNCPDFSSALVSCWQGLNLQGADASVLSEAKLRHLNAFVTKIYSVLYEWDVKLDQIYPTRSSPLNSIVFRRRQIALKKAMMSDNQAFMAKVSQEILALKTLEQGLKPGQNNVTQEPQDGETMFMEDYVPFGMGEICGNFDGFDGDDAVAGLLVQNDLAVNELERKYAADGLYI